MAARRAPIGTAETREYFAVQAGRQWLARPISGSY